jgi:hypothetical protein
VTVDDDDHTATAPRPSRYSQSANRGALNQLHEVVERRPRERQAEPDETRDEQLRDGRCRHRHQCPAVDNTPGNSAAISGGRNIVTLVTETTEWQFHGFLLNGTVIYERQNGEHVDRAYLAPAGDGLEPIGFDLHGGSADRQALETVVEHDLRVTFPDTSIGTPEAFTSLSSILALGGINPMTSVKVNRGRPVKWTPAELRRFASAYIEDGDTGGVSASQTREVMRRAREQGIVIGTKVGRRYEYELVRETTAASDDADAGDQARLAWLETQRFAESLDRNWQRQQSDRASKPESSRDS